MFEPLCLHLQKSRQRAHLLLDRLEPHERIELTLHLSEWTRRLDPHEPIVHPLERIGARGLSKSVAHDFQAANNIRQSTDDHVATMSAAAQAQPRRYGAPRPQPDEIAGPLGEHFSATEVVYLGQSLAYLCLAECWRRRNNSCCSPRFLVSRDAPGGSRSESRPAGNERRAPQGRER